jgi:hypothetical protein
MINEIPSPTPEITAEQAIESLMRLLNQKGVQAVLIERHRCKGAIKYTLGYLLADGDMNSYLGQTEPGTKKIKDQRTLQQAIVNVEAAGSKK